MSFGCSTVCILYQRFIKLRFIRFDLRYAFFGPPWRYSVEYTTKAMLVCARLSLPNQETRSGPGLRPLQVDFVDRCSVVIPFTESGLQFTIQAA